MTLTKKCKEHMLDLTYRWKQICQNLYSVSTDKIQNTDFKIFQNSQSPISKTKWQSLSLKKDNVKKVNVSLPFNRTSERLKGNQGLLYPQG